VHYLTGPEITETAPVTVSGSRGIKAQLLWYGTPLEHWIGSIPRGTGPLDRLALPRWCVHGGES